MRGRYDTKKHSFGHYSVDVDVNINDVLDDISSEDLIAYLRDRDEPFKAEPELSELVEEAVRWLRCGQPDQALLVLDRTLHPKFKKQAECLALYKVARGLQ